MSDLARRAQATNQAMLALGCEAFEADGGTFVRNRGLPALHDSNHVAHVTAATHDEIDRLLALAAREYAGMPHLRFDVDFDTPPEFEARLAHEGFEGMPLLVMVLEGELQGEAKAHDVRLVESEEDWRSYQTLNEMDWQSYVDAGSPAGEWTAASMFQGRRDKSPPSRFWLAYVDGQPRAYLNSWQGANGVGLVDDLFTHPDFRHRGLATALIQRGVADVRERGAGPVVIVAGADDTPRHMYAAMGFRPVAIKRNYTMQLAG